MPGLCRFRHALGAPRAGFHSVRVLDVAVLDVVGTVLVAVPLARALGARLPVVIAALFLAGIALHRLFCVDTTLDRLLFGP